MIREDSATTPAAGPSGLVRGLGLSAATSVNIANMIGTGVFLKTRVMTCNVDTPGMVLLVWVAAGLLALAGALTYAELSAMKPVAGGDYVFIRDAFGRRAGFLFGWAQVSIARTASQAALGVGLAIFCNVLTNGALDRVFFTLHLFGWEVPCGGLQVVAIAAIAIATAINCGAVALSGAVASWLTVIKIGVVAAVGLGALLLADGQWAHLLMSNEGGACADVSASARGGLAGFGAAMLGALWAYDGWNNVAPLAGEVRDPQRNMPRAFILGTVIVGALYVFVNIAYYYVLTPTAIAGVSPSSSVATEVASRFLGAMAVTLMAAALLTSSFGALHTSILGTARFTYAMSRDKLFFRSLADLSPRTHVPVKSLIAQGVWSSLLALSGSYDQLTDYAIFALWIFYGLAGASIFVFRRTQPDAPRPYRTPGYPIVPAVFVLVTAWLVINTLMASPVQSLIGLAMIAAGLPLYEYFARRRD